MIILASQIFFPFSKKNDWIRRFVVAGALAFGATVAVATFGVGTAALPFISGIIIYTASSVLGSIEEHQKVKAELCSRADHT